MTKNTLKTCLAAAACLIAMPAMSAFAGDFSAQPASYDSKAVNYIESRLSDSVGATVRQASQPYQVVAKLKGNKEYNCWAVDYDVRADLGRSSRGAGTYTVLFYNGKAVALTSDLRTRVTRVQTDAVYASR
ncbi:hypothetical protein FF098_001450 [Parvularcula flava]|uniref:Uncharacterized protein n=1 Tax=Aquisalinus luteolus TaxID=1566827 RepID=A0A8J3ENZ0_9PROT|nr:hypothetical protein [Aquisalinus luteolus]NHK26569.1 hypothetical protein [Aquisalinus luteolus]GGH92734.1 hypothetical protein GCM10011355_02930 [Aquisalinus luteolus]